MHRVVLDTNVLVSAHLKERSFPRLAFKAIFRKYVQAYVTRPILDEYERVLSYPKFKFSLEQVQAILTAVRRHFKVIKPAEIEENLVRDPSDKKFLECALRARADFIITGDKKAFRFRSYEGIRVVSAREFLGASLG